jgi:hypothetical protein
LDAWVVFAVAGVSLFHFLLFKIIKPPFPHIDIRLDPSFPFCALFPVIIIIIFLFIYYFFIIIHFRRSFPVSFSSYYTVIHFSLSCFVSRLISFAFVQRTFFFFNINFSPLSTCTVHAFANTLEAARECRKKKTYCRSSFQTFNPFRVFHFPLNIPFVSRWSPPQIVRVNTFFDPKNKKLTL